MATFIWPTNTKRITSKFRDSRKNHHGIDIANPGTRPIYAAADGKVSNSYRSDSYGECVMIVHTINGQTWETLYAHMRSGSRKVKTGQTVKQGQTIGTMGNTGNSTGQHLHFELHKGRWNMQKSNAVDPLKYLDKNISKSAKGAIADIQKGLNKDYNANIAVDNIFGPATKKALIKAYQTELNKQFKAGLSVDGIWGAKTRNATVNVRKNARGKLTWILQAMLVANGYNIAVDGIYGNATGNALKSFQKKNKLSVDGVAGKATWAKLLS